MEIHPQQPPQEKTQNPTVFMHQSVGDGSRHLLQWLDPRPQAKPLHGHAGQEQQPVSPVVFPLIANEITGLPDGMVKPEFDIMLRKGES
eukprot:15749135-Heterocapsa_arctica.AAC.1